MKKNIVAMMLALTLAVSMAACGSKADEAAEEVTTEAAEETSEEAAEETTEEAVEEETAEETVDEGEETEEAAKEAADAAEAAGEVMSHEDFVNAEVDTEVTVETYVQAKQGWWEDNGVGQATIYTQAEDGAYFLYNMPCTEDEYNELTEGTKIKVTGYKSEWEGEVEITDATYEILDGNYVAEAKDVTSELSAETLIDSQNEFVAFKGMTVEPSTDADGNEVAFLYNYDGSGEPGSDLYFNVSVDGQTYTFTVESYLCDKDSDVYKAVEGLNVGDVVDMEGFLYWYQGVNPHITSVTVK